MDANLAQISILVKDYDEAIDYYTVKLGFDLVGDTELGEGKRWVVVKPKGSGSASIVLAKAEADQINFIGKQGGGRVFLFLHTDDFWRDHQRMTENGVVFKEEPRTEVYGTVAVFEDLYGNFWDLLESKTND